MCLSYSWLRPLHASTMNKPEDLVERLKTIRVKITSIMRNYVPPFTVNPVEVDTDWIAKRLEKLPNWTWGRWLPLDGKYYTVTLDEWARMAKWDVTNYLPYIVDRFDCDKYSLLFKARMAEFFGVNAAAVVLDYDAGHAYNLIFPSDLDEPLIYEPQNDRFIRIRDRDTRFYALYRRYLVLL